MNSISRRRFLLDLAAVGGLIPLLAGDQLQARPVPDPELKKKMDDVLDKVFKKEEPPPRPRPKQPPPPHEPPPTHFPLPGGMPPPQRPPKS